MATARFLIVVAAILVAATQFVFGAPAIEGIALCKQPLPGDKDWYQTLDNLVLVNVPSGKPVRLFLNMPAAIPATFGAVDAWLIDDGRLVLINGSHENRSKGEYLLTFQPATNKVKMIAADVARDSIAVSLDRNTVVYSLRGSKAIRVWNIAGRQLSVAPPKGYEYSVRQVAHSPHLLVTRSRRDEKSTRHFWLNEARGTLTPIAENSLWLKGEDSCRGRYVYADKNWDLWLVGPGHKKAKLARLQVEGERPEVVWCRFSPDANYILCNFGRAVGEPHINWAGDSLFFDLRSEKPAVLKPDYDSDVAGGDVVEWCDKGILHMRCEDLMWTDLPSLKTEKILTLPDKCVFIDFLRRDATSARGKQN